MREDLARSAGKVEGQVNRLKTLKPQMYGGGELLRTRLMPLSTEPAALQRE